MLKMRRRLVIVAAFAVVSFPARSGVDQAPTAAAEVASDLMSSVGAGGASCTHPLFGNAAGNAPFSVAIGDLDGDLDLDLAVANQSSDDVSVLLNQGEQFALDTAIRAISSGACTTWRPPPIWPHDQGPHASSRWATVLVEPWPCKPE